MIKKIKQKNAQLYQKLILSCEDIDIPFEDELSPEILYQNLKAELSLLNAIYIEHCSYAELAKKLNISLSACKMRVNRAKQAFRKQFSDE